MKDIVIDSAIRKVPDFPKPGVLFYDITGILESPKAFKHCIDLMIEFYKDEKIDAVAGLESRGFIFASPFAERLGLPLILVRKAGKLPGATFACSYELEYGKSQFEVLQSSVKKDSRVLLVDDLIATGGSLEAAGKMFEDNGAKIIGCFGVIGLPFLNYEKKLKHFPIKTLINYSSE